MTAHHAALFMVPGVIPDFSDLGQIGNKNDSTANQSSTTLTTTAVAAAGNCVIVIIAVDNNQTTDGDEGAVSSITDSAGGNTWTKMVEFTNGQGAAQAGATVSIWRSVLTNQIASGGTITANFTNNTSRDKSCMTARKFSVRSGTTVTAEGTAGTLANDAADPGSLNVTTTGAQACLRVRGIASESNSATTLTPTSGWTAFTGDQTSGGASAANMKVSGEFKISTETSSASDPSLVAADTASGYACLKTS